MAAFSSVPTKASGDPYVLAMWNTYVRDNFNKLGGQMHRLVTVAAFAALTPEDGDEVYLEVDATNGIYWHLRYRSASASAYKWEFLGGAPMTSEVATSESTSSASYTDLATAGPTVTVPRAGDYIIQGFVGYSTGNAGAQSYAAVKLGSAATADAEIVLVTGQGGSGTINVYGSGGQTMRRTLAASDVVKVQYKSTSGSLPFAYRRLAVFPVRVS